MNIIKLSDIKTSEIEIYTGLNEKQLKRFYEPDQGLFICESTRVIERALLKGYEPESFLVEESKLNEVSEIIGERNTPVYVLPYESMKRITGYSLTGGVLSAMRRKPLPSVLECIKNCSRIVVLDDVENPTNVGAIFRSAVALGADAILLTHGCADPLYRRAARVSMGSVFLVDWTYAEKNVAEELKRSGFELFALALSDNAKKLGDFSFDNKKNAVILGNEDHGISEHILAYADHEVIIPMQHEVDSLNVAAASAVAFWEIFSKHKNL